MSKEEIKIKGLIMNHQIRSTDRVTLKQLKTLIKDEFLSTKYYEIIIQMLENMPHVDIYKAVPLSIVFQIMDTLQFDHFVNSQSPFLNNRSTRINIRIIKAALIIYTRNYAQIEDTKNHLLIFQLKENELKTEGIPCDIQLINKILSKNNQSIYSKVLNLWIEKYNPFLEFKDQLQSYEFLFLASNAECKQKYLQKIPQLVMEAKMDENNLFKLNDNLNKDLKTREQIIQQQMQYVYDEQKLTKKSQSLQKQEDVNNINEQKNLETEIEIKQKKKKKKNKKSNENIYLRPELIMEIRLKNNQFQKVQNHSKQANQSLRYKITQDMAMKQKLYGTENSFRNIKEIIHNEQQYKKLLAMQKQSLINIQQNDNYQRQQKTCLKPVHEKIIEDYMSDIQLHRKFFKQQVEENFVNSNIHNKCSKRTQFNNNYFNNQPNQEQIIDSQLYNDKQIELMKNKQRMRISSSQPNLKFRNQNVIIRSHQVQGVKEVLCQIK